jgi:hypothetical protein
LADEERTVSDQSRIADDQIQVLWCEGDEHDAFAMAVQSNVAHGLPLSLADRRQAAVRIIRSHPHLSDRMIASIVNLAASTIGVIRARSSAHPAPSDARIGRDGRMRPLNTCEARRLAGELLHESPDAPLREIAKSTGLALATVQDVRKRMRNGRDPVPSRQRRRAFASEQADESARPTTSPIRQRDYRTALANLTKDPSLRYTDVGRMLLVWLQTGPTDLDGQSRIAEQLPPHCLEVVATLARAHAAAWQEFVHQLESRTTQISQSG